MGTVCEDGCVDQRTWVLKWQLGLGLTRMWVFVQCLQQAQGSNHGVCLGTELAVWLGKPACRGELVPLSEWGGLSGV